MTGLMYILLGLTFATGLKAAPGADARVKNLTLIGVIHVEGARAKGQSVAVLREKSTGRTRILHKGESIVDADLELRDFGPQQVTLARGQQIFVLRVENQTEGALPGDVESTEMDLIHEKSSDPAQDVPMAADGLSEMPTKIEAPSEQRRLIPDADCVGEDCPLPSE